MAKFIALTADDNTGTPILINVDHIVSVVSEGFTGLTKIMVPGAMFSVKEDLDIVKGLILPN